MTHRPLGVRVYILASLMILTVVSVGLTGLLTYRDVEAELSAGETHLAAKLPGCILRAVVEAGSISIALALLLAVPLSVGVARPLRRLNEMASRMVTTGAAGRGVSIGGGREIGQLGATLERLAATLRRQHELRRATAADVTHELRGGLGAVIGRVEATRDGLLDAETVLQSIGEDARRMGRILDDLQLLVEAQRPEGLISKESADLAAIVRGRVSSYAQRYRAAAISLDHHIEPAWVHGDPERLAQVVDNLLANALRYTDANGRVSVTVTRDEGESVIEVTDSGVGISEAYIDRIFDRFWRAPGASERAAEGSGVGLAVVRDLVRAHHGRVEVTSRPGHGSRFSVRLPADGNPDPAGAARTPAAGAGSAQRGPLQRDLNHRRAFV